MIKVDHVGKNMNNCPSDNRPGSCLVESDVLVEWYDVVERRTTEEGDKVTANGEEDEDDINMEDECRCTSDRYMSSMPSKKLRTKGQSAKTHGR
jgi:hypothetical protein